MNGETVYIQHYDSPFGKMVLASVGDELCLCDWSEMPCAERNMHRLARLMHASFKTESTSVLDNSTNISQALAPLSPFRYALWAPISNNACGTPCSKSHTVPHAATKTLPLASAIQKPSGPLRKLSEQTASASSSHATA